MKSILIALVFTIAQVSANFRIGCSKYYHYCGDKLNITQSNITSVDQLLNITKELK